VKAQAGEGPKLTARIPSWLQLSRDRQSFEVRPVQAETVRRIFEECAAGVGTMACARRLMEAGVPTLGTSRGWQPSTIKKILANEAVLGIFQAHSLQAGKRIPEGNPIPDYFPAVVSTSLFWAARQALGERRSGSSGRKGLALSNLFTGLARCGACGGAMHFINKGAPPKGGRYLQCDTARRGAGCIMRDLYRYDDVEAGICLTMSQRTFATIFRTEADTVQEWKTAAGETSARLEILNEKQKRLLSIIEDDTDGVDDALSARVKALREEIAVLHRERANLNDRIRDASQSEGAEMEDLLDHVLGHVQAIGELDDDAERYRQRSRVAQGLRRAITTIIFHIDWAKIAYVDGEEGQVILGPRALDPATQQLADAAVRFADAARAARDRGAA